MCNRKLWQCLLNFSIVAIFFITCASSVQALSFKRWSPESSASTKKKAKPVTPPVSTETGATKSKAVPSDIPENPLAPDPLPQQSFALAYPGAPPPIDYEKYGTFTGVGTANYKYTITNRKGLSEVSGAGVYPATDRWVTQDPAYKPYADSGQLRGSHWDFTNIKNHQLAFFKWATAREDPGVKQFVTAQIFEKAGLLKQAIKAYYAVVVHFPKSVGWTYWHTPWYPGPVAIDKIVFLTRRYPDLGLKLESASIKIQGRYDDNIANDVFIINPGKLVSCSRQDLIPQRADLQSLKVVKTIGSGSVKLLQYENHHWQLTVNDKPAMVKAVAYTPNKVGLSPDNGTLVVHTDWMTTDFNKNGVIDGPFEAWVDVNRNNRPDKSDVVKGDFQLLKEMGANAIRLYHHATNKELLREGYERFGLMYLMGDYLGMYAVGSGAQWYQGTDYTNLKQCENMKASVREMVEEYKNEPYIMMWVLGNENNYGVVGDEKSPGLGCRAKEQPDAYYKFVNEVAKMVKEIDPYQRPVAICNGDALYLDKFARYCPDVDVFGMNSYRGSHGFGQSTWEDIRDLCDKPVMVTEYGCPAYMIGESREVAELAQANYLRGCWEDMYYNSAGYGVGNVIGGVQFEFLDEWWKAGPPPQFDPAVHDTQGIDYASGEYLPGNFTAPFPDGWMHEEWLGICSQGERGKYSPFLRQLRPAYYLFQRMWTQ